METFQRLDSTLSAPLQWGFQAHPCPGSPFVGVGRGYNLAMSSLPPGEAVYHERLSHTGQLCPGEVHSYCLLIQPGEQ